MMASLVKSSHYLNLCSCQTKTFRQTDRSCRKCCLHQQCLRLTDRQAGKHIIGAQICRQVFARQTDSSPEEVLYKTACMFQVGCAARVATKLMFQAGISDKQTD